MKNKKKLTSSSMSVTSTVRIGVKSSKYKATEIKRFTQYSRLEFGILAFFTNLFAFSAVFRLRFDADDAYVET